jgi:hypothetical protein
LTVSLEHGARLHKHDDVQAMRPQPVKPNPEQAIDRREPDTAGTLAAWDCQLAAKRNDLKLHFRAAAKPTSVPRPPLVTFGAAARISGVSLKGEKAMD